MAYEYIPSSCEPRALPHVAQRRGYKFWMRDALAEWLTPFPLHNSGWTGQARLLFRMTGVSLSRPQRYLLIDVSNSFTKLAFATAGPVAQLRLPGRRRVEILMP